MVWRSRRPSRHDVATAAPSSPITPPASPSGSPSSAANLALQARPTWSRCCCTTSGGALAHEALVRQLRRSSRRAASASRRVCFSSRFASAAGSISPASDTYASKSGRTIAAGLLRLRHVRPGRRTLPTPASGPMNGASASKSVGHRRRALHGHVERRLVVHLVAVADLAHAAHQVLHPGDARLHRRVAPRRRVAPATGRCTRSPRPASGVGRPRSEAASFSACQSDSATNGMTGCTSRRMPSSTPTSTRWASGRAAGVLEPALASSRRTSRRTPTR